MYYTVHHSQALLAQIPVPHEACPHCQSNALVMYFSRSREDSFFHAVVHKKPLAEVHCAACDHEVGILRFGKGLHTFFKQHSKAYESRLRFWFKWQTIGVMLAFILAIAVFSKVEISTASASKENRALTNARLASPQVGDIFEFWHVVAGPKSAADPEGVYGNRKTQIWLKVVRVEGDQVIVLKSKRSYDMTRTSPRKNIDPSKDDFEPTELVVKNRNSVWQVQGDDATYLSWQVTPAK